MRRQLALIFILVWFHPIDGFSKAAPVSRKKIQTCTTGRDNGKSNFTFKLVESKGDYRSSDEVTLPTSTSPSPSCPFSKHFPKYRIDFTRVKKSTDQGRLSLRIPFVSNIQMSMQKSQWQKKFPPSVSIEWLEGLEEAGGVVPAIIIFERLWRAASDLYSNSIVSAAKSPVSSTCRIVLGMTDTSIEVVQYWVDILNWMQNEESLRPLIGNSKINATIYNEGGMLLVELDYQGSINNALSSSTSSQQPYDPAALTRRTKAWVKRILIDQGICPFTKSVKVSGQGLGDLGIPVARIHYCSSDARQHQLCQLMAGTF